MTKRTSLPTLMRQRATLFPAPCGGHETALAAITPTLRPLYAAFNGGYFWGGALLVRPLTAVVGAPRTLAEWNEPLLWASKYLGICDDLVCFAEDVFGEQFCARGSEIVRFNPETSGVRKLADSVDEWIELMLDDSDRQAGTPYLERWEEEHPSLRPGSRLLPKQLFFLGGDYETENFVEKADTEGMVIRPEIWDLTRHLPEGSTVAFRVEPNGEPPERDA